MKVTSTVTSESISDPTPVYPCIKRLRRDPRFVVYFISEKRGMRLSSPQSDQETLLQLGDGFISALDDSEWATFCGKIELNFE